MQSNNHNNDKSHKGWCFEAEIQKWSTMVWKNITYYYFEDFPYFLSCFLFQTIVQLFLSTARNKTTSSWSCVTRAHKLILKPWLNFFKAELWLRLTALMEGATRVVNSASINKHGGTLLVPRIPMWDLIALPLWNFLCYCLIPEQHFCKHSHRNIAVIIQNLRNLLRKKCFKSANVSALNAAISNKKRDQTEKEKTTWDRLLASTFRCFL